MLRRIIPATAAAALLLAGATGCSAQQAQASDCTATLQPGALSDSTTVLGSFGEVPEISAPEDIEILSTQRTVVESGDSDGYVAGEQSLVGVNMAFFDAASGETLFQSEGFADSSRPPQPLLVAEETANPLSEAVRCTVPGDRVVLALSPEESTQLAGQLGAPGADAIVGVVDVVSTAPIVAEGPARGLPNGFPAVVTNEEGRAGVVLPPTDAPAGTTAAVRIEGDGAEVTATDNVIAQVLAVGWDGTEQENTWNTGLKLLYTEADMAQSGVTYRAELTGQSIGSQVVIVENEDGANARVVVVDILGVS
ncbi:peptidylprolyl isomerase [Leucobacter sp. USCH14]|uniref:peptidylprolyl isomerase n=1 Tax=Leucobacter sp. USCH14 TaxID=3024838 RepID=UPI0030B39585